MKLSEVFSTIFYKVIARTELESSNNHQHELNAGGMKELFNYPKRRLDGSIEWFYLGNDGIESEESEFTYYDARERHPTRSEWRLYYKTHFITLHASEGDLLVITRHHSGRLYGFIFEKSSSWFNSAFELFALEASPLFGRFLKRSNLERIELEEKRKLLFQEAGLDLLPYSSSGQISDDIRIITGRYGSNFPTTRDMSEFARQNTETTGDPDRDLVNWLTREEELFRALEKNILEERIKKGFENVDDFTALALSFMNRRKSRMGYALQNHLEEIFKRERLVFESQVITEDKHRPDFIFPGAASYHNRLFRKELLTFLGAKSSLKDRWRQILNESERIDRKHLCTIQQNTSRDQLNEMEKEKVTLVVPEPLAYSYSNCNNVITLGEFIVMERNKQNRYME